MTLPDDFNPTQHLLDMLRSAYNREVQQSFLGVPDNDISTSLGGMKLGCLLLDDDTVAIVTLRLFLYYFVFQGNLPTPVYGIPTGDFQADVSFRPQIILHFLEDYNAFLHENKLPRTEARISFRLMNQTSATITPIFAREIGLKIQELFALSHGFSFEKGVIKFTYRDQVHGYDFRLLVESEAEAVKVIERVLEVQGHAFDETKATVSRSKQVFPVVPGNTEVYGKLRRKPRKRPITTVRFRRADLHVHGIPRAITLVDLTGKRHAVISPVI